MAAEFADWLFRSALALAVAIALVLALRPLWRRWLGSSSVLWLWLLLPAALVATSWPRPTVVAEFAVAPTVVAATSGFGQSALPNDLRPATAAMAAGRASATDAPARADAAPAFWRQYALVIAWGLGALWVLLRLVTQQRRFLRRLGPLRRRPDGAYLASSNRIGPAVVGALRPRIVLPADFEHRYDERQRALVLAHERCHLRRGDLQVNLLASALRCVFWFNPLVHLAATRLRVDQELACDAAVLRDHPDAGRAYATALLNTQLADLGLPVGCYWQSSQSLKWRIAMLKRPSPGAARLLAGATLALLASSAAAASLWQLQPVATIAAPAAGAVPPMLVPATTLDLSTTLVSPVPRPDAGRPVESIAPAVIAAPALPALPADVMRHAAPALPEAGEAGLEAAVDGDLGWVPPRVVTAVPASRPMRDRDMTRPPQGTVVVRAEIDAEGKLQSASVESSDLGPAYRVRARRAVERWTFEPARKNGEAVAATVLVPVYFLADFRRTEMVNGMDVPGAQLRKREPQPVKWPSAIDY